MFIPIPGFEVVYGDFTELNVDFEKVYVNEQLLQPNLQSFLSHRYFGDLHSRIAARLEYMYTKTFNELRKYELPSCSLEFFFTRLEDIDVRAFLKTKGITYFISHAIKGTRLVVTGVESEFKVYFTVIDGKMDLTTDKSIITTIDNEIRREVAQTFSSLPIQYKHRYNTYEPEYTYIQDDVLYCELPAIYLCNVGAANKITVCSEAYIMIPKIEQSATKIKVGHARIGHCMWDRKFQGMVLKDGRWKPSSASAVQMPPDIVGAQRCLGELFDGTCTDTALTSLFDVTKLMGNLYVITSENAERSIIMDRAFNVYGGIWIKNQKLEVCWLKDQEIPAHIEEEISRYMLACQLVGE